MVRLYNYYGPTYDGQVERKQSYPTDVVNLRFKGPTFSFPAIALQSKGQTFKNLEINRHIETTIHIYKAQLLTIHYSILFFHFSIKMAPK